MPNHRAALVAIALLVFASSAGCSTTEPAQNGEEEPVELSEEDETPETEDEREPPAEPPSPAEPEPPEAPEPEPEDDDHGTDDESNDDESDDDESNEEAQQADERAIEALAAKYPDETYRYSDPIEVAGWLIVRVRDSRMSHPRPECVVLRQDYTLVESDKSDELLEIFEAKGVFDDEWPPQASERDLSRTANALVGDCRGVINNESAVNRNDDFSDVHLRGPRIRREDDAFRLEFFGSGSDFRDESVYRTTVVFTTDEVLEADVDEFIPDDADYERRDDVIQIQ